MDISGGGGRVGKSQLNEYFFFYRLTISKQLSLPPAHQNYFENCPPSRQSCKLLIFFCGHPQFLHFLTKPGRKWKHLKNGYIKKSEVQ